MLLLRIDPRDTLARGRTLDHPDLVPDDATDIKLIEQHAVAPRIVAIDSGGVPPGAARRRYAIGVQFGSDGARRGASNKACKNPSHDCGLRGVDDEFARRTGDDRITVGTSAGVAAIADHALESAS